MSKPILFLQQIPHYLISTRMVSILLTFGLFFMLSCTAFERSSDSGTGFHRGIENELRELNQQLQAEPENETLLLRKGELLFQLADQLAEPHQRTDIYREITTLSSSTVFQRDPDLTILNEKRKLIWNREQSSGIRLHQQDKSEGTNRQHQQIADHFQNAIAILPDSLVTYSLLATTYYERGEVQQAINTLHLAMEENESVKPEIIEKLAWLLLETGDTEQSVSYYEQLVRENPSNSHFLHGLVNAYVISRMNARAVERLSLMTQEFPARTYYLETLFEQYYFLIESMATSYLQPEMTQNNPETAIADILLTAGKFEEIFTSLKERVPMSEELHFKTGLYFNYLADLLDTLAEHENSRGESGSQISEKSDLSRKQALELIEKAAELNPDRLEYRYRLHEIYLRLNMTDEADQIERTLSL
ncbi:MAG: hypothetical protein EA360_07365 [Balneolaceae bacterium]|nr:MAG: hypothetical protein EA360_07365 [Balneolaceae bacterium]